VPMIDRGRPGVYHAQYIDVIIVLGHQLAGTRRAFCVYGVRQMDLFLGDVLDPAVRDPLRKSFGLQPWPVVRRQLTPPDAQPTPADNSLRVARPVAPPASMGHDDYVRLMQERPRDRLGSAV